MQELTSDFYKRFNREGGMAKNIFCPYSAAMFGGAGIAGIIPTLGVRLDFGALAAYRKRDDGRVSITNADSDVCIRFNVENIERLTYPRWAKEVAESMMRLPGDLCGMDIMFDSDTGKKELSPTKLCAALAMSEAEGQKFSAKVLLHAAGAPAEFTASLLEQPYRAAIVNTATYDIIPYEFDVGANKIIIIKIPSRRTKADFDRAYQKRELDRINGAAAAVKNKDVQNFGQLMSAASEDMLRVHRRKKAEILYSACRRVCASVRIMHDYCSAAAIVPEKDVEAFLQTVNSGYEKKAGDNPTFYVSD